MKFIHAADIHLDSPLVGLAAYDGAPVDLLRGATRRALQGMVDLAEAEAVDFVVIAGDVYDGDWRDFNTGLFFVQQMARLRQRNIPVYVIHGNHDAESQISRKLPLPENVTVFSSRKAETHPVPGSEGRHPRPELQAAGGAGQSGGGLQAACVRSLQYRRAAHLGGWPRRPRRLCALRAG